MGDAAKVLKLAGAQVGYREGYSGGHWNNYQKFSAETPGFAWSQNMAWCDTFVAWVFYKSGLYAELPVKSASCLQSVAGFKKAKRFSTYPAVGAQVFFGSGGGTHTGIVEKYDNTYIYTIEGNTNGSGSPEGNGVYRKTHKRTASNVYGYGYPLFKEGIDSADPAWAKQKPKTVAAKAAAVVKKKPWIWFPNLQPGVKSNSANILQRALIKDVGGQEKDLKVTGVFDAATKKAYARVQRNLGLKGADADGIPGEKTLRFIANKYGFDIKGKPAGKARR